MVKAAACVHIGIAALLFASHANAAMITSDVEGQPCDCGGYCHKSRAAMLERIQAPVRKAEVASSRFLGTKPIVLFEQRSLQPIGLRVHKKPGMHCNCHCNFDPFAWQRQFPPPFDLRNLPATPAPPLPSSHAVRQLKSGPDVPRQRKTMDLFWGCLVALVCPSCPTSKPRIFARLSRHRQALQRPQHRPQSHSRHHHLHRIPIHPLRVRPPKHSQPGLPATASILQGTTFLVLPTRL